jgi:hypothetical protein
LSFLTKEIVDRKLSCSSANLIAFARVLLDIFPCIPGFASRRHALISHNLSRYVIPLCYQYTKQYLTRKVFLGENITEPLETGLGRSERPERAMSMSEQSEFGHFSKQAL